MHVAARANALHDLLPEIATLAEVQRTRLRGFLWQVALGDVDTVDRNSLRHAECVQRCRSHRGRARGRQGTPQQRQSRERRANLKVVG